MACEGMRLAPFCEESDCVDGTVAYQVRPCGRASGGRTEASHMGSITDAFGNVGAAYCHRLGCQCQLLKVASGYLS